MEDSEQSQTAVIRSINSRFILAACFAQLLAPPAGLTLFDLIYANNDGFSAITIAIGIVKAIPHTWQLAMEPLLIAVFFAAIASMLPNQRTAIGLIVLVTVLNVLASGMLIVCRSL